MEHNYIPAARADFEAAQYESARIAELRMELIEEMNGLGPIAPRVTLSEFEARYKLPRQPYGREIFRNVMATSEAMARATVYFFDPEAFEIYIQQTPRSLKPSPGNSMPSERALEVGR